MVVLKRLRNIFEEDQAQRDMLIFRRLKIAAQFVGHFEQVRFKPQVAAADCLRCHMFKLTPDTPCSQCYASKLRFWLVLWSSDRIAKAGRFLP